MAKLGQDWLLKPTFHGQEGGQETAVKMNQKTPSLYSSKLSFLIYWFINCLKINKRTSRLPAPCETKSFGCRVPRVRLAPSVPQPQLVQMFTWLTKHNCRRWAAGKNVYRLLPCKGLLRALQIAPNLPTGNAPSTARRTAEAQGSSLSLQTTAILLLSETCNNPKPQERNRGPPHKVLRHIQVDHLLTRKLQRRFGLQCCPLCSWFCKAGVSPHIEKADNPHAYSKTTFLYQWKKPSKMVPQVEIWVSFYTGHLREVADAQISSSKIHHYALGEILLELVWLSSPNAHTECDSTAVNIKLNTTHHLLLPSPRTETHLTSAALLQKTWTISLLMALSPTTQDIHFLKVSLC